MSMSNSMRADRLRAYRPHGETPGTVNVTGTQDNLITVLEKAIRDKMALRIAYAPGTREIEPHALGITADGNYVLRAWQVRGAGAVGESANAWKLFRLDKMEPILQVGPVFDGPRPGYKRGDRAMRGGILVEL